MILAVAKVAPTIGAPRSLDARIYQQAEPTTQRACNNVRPHPPLDERVNCCRQDPELLLLSPRWFLPLGSLGRRL